MFGIYVATCVGSNICSTGWVIYFWKINQFHQWQWQNPTRKSLYANLEYSLFVNTNTWQLSVICEWIRFTIWSVYILYIQMNSVWSVYNISLSLPPLSLKQTRSFLLGPHLEHSIPRSMKADATLQQGTWRAYRAVAPSTRFLYPTAWTTIPMSMTFTLIMAPNPATRPTCSAPQRAAQWTSTTDTHHEVPSTLTVWWCPLSWCLRLRHLTTSPAAHSPGCTTALSTMTQSHGTTALPSQPLPPLQLSPPLQQRLLPPRTCPAPKAIDFPLTCLTSLRNNCLYTEMASTHYNTSALPPPLSNAARVLAALDTSFIPFKSSSPSPTPWRDHPRWMAQKVTTWEAEWVIITMAITPPNTGARGAKAKNASIALEDGGAPMTTWTVTAPTGHLVWCRGTMASMPAIVTQTQCTVTTLGTFHSRPQRVTMTLSAQPVRPWPWLPRASSWRGARGQHSPSVRPRKLIGSHRLI